MWVSTVRLTTDSAYPQTPRNSLRGGNRIFTLQEAARVLPRPDVPEDDVAPYGAKEGDPGTDEHGNPRDNKALNEPGHRGWQPCLLQIEIRT